MHRIISIIGPSGVHLGSWENAIWFLLNISFKHDIQSKLILYEALIDEASQNSNHVLFMPFPFCAIIRNELCHFHFLLVSCNRI